LRQSIAMAGVLWIAVWGGLDAPAALAQALPPALDSIDSVIPPLAAEDLKNLVSDFAPPPDVMGFSTASPAVVFHEPAVDEPWRWQLLPDGLLYKSYAAGEREPRLSTAFLQESGGDILWDSALGGRMGIVRYGTDRTIQPEGWQLDVEGAAFVRLLPQDERDVNAVDFRAGVPLTYRAGPWQYKFAYYHISSHLGDEFLLKNPDFVRLNYSRDALVAGVGYLPNDHWRLYFEVGWAVIYTSGGAEPWEIQTGLEYGTQQPTGIQGAPYFALNIHLREEVNWGGSLNLLAGWQWRGYRADHTFRAGFQYYNGKNAQYSLLQDNQVLYGLGIRYDY